MKTKLNLKKETLKNLQSPQLAGVQGGDTTSNTIKIIIGASTDPRTILIGIIDNLPRKYGTSLNPPDLIAQ